MDIKCVVNGNELKMFLEGRLDTSTAPMLEEKVNSELKATINSLIFDFSKLEYISSAGLRVMLMCSKKMKSQGNMEIINCNESILDVFTITGFNDFLNIK